MGRKYTLSEASLVRGKRIANNLPLEQRFWLQVKKTRGCWLWIGWKDKDGYGVIRVNSIGKRATHVSMYLQGKPVPKGMLVCHTCDNPSCVKPNHLFIGNHSDNAFDASRKGRLNPNKGEDCNLSTLNNSIVLDIRRRYAEVEPYRGLITELAREFGVSYRQVYKVVNRFSWKHI